MARHAFFRFHGSLNDFVPSSKRNLELPYSFKGQPSLKDAIESIGVPHVEIAEVRVNGNPAPLTYTYWDSAQVDVHPVVPVAGQEQAFVADTHLGKLARALRMLGFDTIYTNESHERELVRIASDTNRLLLTRSINLLKHGSLRHGYWVRSGDPEQQVQEVAKRFQLVQNAQPFSRCLLCNGIIEPVDKLKVEAFVPPLTVRHFNEFYQCDSCRKIYWKGSHYERMLQLIHRLEK